LRKNKIILYPNNNNILNYYYYYIFVATFKILDLGPLTNLFKSRFIGLFNYVFILKLGQNLKILIQSLEK